MLQEVLLEWLQDIIEQHRHHVQAVVWIACQTWLQMPLPLSDRQQHVKNIERQAWPALGQRGAHPTLLCTR